MHPPGRGAAVRGKPVRKAVLVALGAFVFTFSMVNKVCFGIWNLPVMAPTPNVNWPVLCCR